MIYFLHLLGDLQWKVLSVWVFTWNLRQERAGSGSDGLCSEALWYPSHTVYHNMISSVFEEKGFIWEYCWTGFIQSPDKHWYDGEWVFFSFKEQQTTVKLSLVWLCGWTSVCVCVYVCVVAFTLLNLPQCVHIVIHILPLKPPALHPLSVSPSLHIARILSPSLHSSLHPPVHSSPVSFNKKSTVPCTALFTGRLHFYKSGEQMWLSLESILKSWECFRISDIFTQIWAKIS